MSKTALIIGATGLTGEQCLVELVSTKFYSSIVVLARKKLHTSYPLVKSIVSDFENLEYIAEQLKADDVFCCIGTTIAKAGSQNAFRKVDFEIPMRVAVQAKQNGAKKFIHVSSLGANASSPVFYSRVKGELEEALAKIDFDSLIIFRPSILLGNRKEKRTGEALGQLVAEKFSYLFAGRFKRYKGTPVQLLAKAMVKTAQEKIKGIRIVENEEIFELAEK